MFSGIHLRATSQRVPNLLCCIMSLKMIRLNLLPHRQGANQFTCFVLGLYHQFLMDWYCSFAQTLHHSQPTIIHSKTWTTPDSKVHGANMGPTWVLSAPDGPHVGPMNLAIRDVHYSWDALFHIGHLATGQLPEALCQDNVVSNVLSVGLVHELVRQIPWWNPCQLTSIFKRICWLAGGWADSQWEGRFLRKYW